MRQISEFVGVLVVVLAFCAHGTSKAEEEARSATSEVLAAVLKREGVEIASPTLLRIEKVHLMALPWSAVRVRVIGRVPAEEAILVHSGKDWKVLLLNKNLATRWGRAITPLLKTTPYPKGLSPSSVAEDLTKLLVDPDERFGKVISTSSDIPAADPLSDPFRDLVRSGKSRKEIRETLLAPLKRHPEGASRQGSGSDSVITFDTWGFFGGEVARWKIGFGRRAKAKRTVCCVYVGSWDFYK